MKFLLLLPFTVQPILIFFDEIFFHIKRDLPKFERLGHPLDTLTVFVCFLYAYLIPYSPLHAKILVAFIIFSCIFVTKDEFIHKKFCPATEQWLHAVLFLNHPVLLGSLFILWLSKYEVINWVDFSADWTKNFIGVQLGFCFLFGLYQIIYWNLIRKPMEENERSQ